jgi:hypothetical protein
MYNLRKTSVLNHKRVLLQLWFDGLGDPNHDTLSTKCVNLGHSYDQTLLYQPLASCRESPRFPTDRVFVLRILCE